MDVVFVTKEILVSTKFARSLMQFFTGPQLPLASQDVATYFSTIGPRFTGSEFDRMCDTSHPNVITERDLVAVTMLGVDIPPRAALWILSKSGRSQIEHRLAAVDEDVDI